MVMLDHEIPYRPGGTPRAQNTEYALKELSDAKGDRMPPVIIFANRLSDVDDEDKYRWAANMRSRGATTFLCKPLSTSGRTLDRVIEKILSGQTDNVRIKSNQYGMDEIPKGKVLTEKIKKIVAKKPDAAVDQDNLLSPANKPLEPTVPDDKDSSPAAAKPAADVNPWASIPNDSVEIDEFMVRFCEHRSKDNRKHRKRALLAAARHKTVTLPPLAAARKHGQSNKYFVHDLLAAWQEFLDEGVDVPPVLPMPCSDSPHRPVSR